MRVLTKRTEPHKHYGALTAKAYAVGKALNNRLAGSRKKPARVIGCPPVASRRRRGCSCSIDESLTAA
jgi:hypothetical protein